MENKSETYQGKQLGKKKPFIFLPPSFELQSKFWLLSHVLSHALELLSVISQDYGNWTQSQREMRSRGPLPPTLICSIITLPDTQHLHTHTQLGFEFLEVNLRPKTFPSGNSRTIRVHPHDFALPVPLRDPMSSRFSYFPHHLNLQIYYFFLC